MVYYPVLAGEIAKRGIKKKAIAESIGVCNKSLNNKLAGRVPFTWPEVELIRNQFFPDMSAEGLFSRFAQSEHSSMTTSREKGEEVRR